MAVNKAKLKKDIEKEVSEIDDVLNARAVALTPILEKYLNSKPTIRKWSDFISVSDHQRRLVGRDTQKHEVEGSLEVNIVKFGG